MNHLRPKTRTNQLLSAVTDTEHPNTMNQSTLDFNKRKKMIQEGLNRVSTDMDLNKSFIENLDAFRTKGGVSPTLQPSHPDSGKLREQALLKQQKSEIFESIPCQDPPTLNNANLVNKWSQRKLRRSRESQEVLNNIDQKLRDKKTQNIKNPHKSTSQAISRTQINTSTSAQDTKQFSVIHQENNFDKTLKTVKNTQNLQNRKRGNSRQYSSGYGSQSSSSEFSEVQSGSSATQNPLISPIALKVNKRNKSKELVPRTVRIDLQSSRQHITAQQINTESSSNSPGILTTQNRNTTPKAAQKDSGSRRAPKTSKNSKNTHSGKTKHHHGNNILMESFKPKIKTTEFANPLQSAQSHLQSTQPLKQAKNGLKSHNTALYGTEPALTKHYSAGTQGHQQALQSPLDDDINQLRRENQSLRETLKLIRKHLQEEKEVKKNLKKKEADLQSANKGLKKVIEDLEIEKKGLEAELENLRSKQFLVREQHAKAAKMSSTLQIQLKESKKLLGEASQELNLYKKQIYGISHKIRKFHPELLPGTKTDSSLVSQTLSLIKSGIQVFCVIKSKKIEISDLEILGQNGGKGGKKSAWEGARSGREREESHKNENSSKKFLEAARVIDRLVSRIDDMNSNFADCVVDDQRTIDTKIFYPSMMTFFDQIEEIRKDQDFKKLMREYHLS